MSSTTLRQTHWHHQSFLALVVVFYQTPAPDHHVLLVWSGSAQLAGLLMFNHLVLLWRVYGNRPCCFRSLVCRDLHSRPAIHQLSASFRLAYLHLLFFSSFTFSFSSSLDGCHAALAWLPVEVPELQIRSRPTSP